MFICCGATYSQCPCQNYTKIQANTYDFTQGGSLPSLSGGNYKLIFQDEFTGSVVDTNKWRAQGGMSCRASPQSMMLVCVHDSNNVIPKPQSATGIAGKLGTLKLRIRYDSVYTSNYPQTNTTRNRYSSAELHTGKGGKKTILFGNGTYFEVRAKFPTPSSAGLGNGSWPAFWLWNNYPTYQEIDFYEWTGINTSPSHVLSNVHWKDDSNRVACYLGTPPTPPARCADQVWHHGTPASNLLNTWNTYGVEWSTSEVKFYVNGRLIRTFSGTGVPTYPMDFLLSHVALDTVRNLGASGQPYEIEVDYVRVFSKPQKVFHTVHFPKPNMCANAGDAEYLEVPFYPDATYSWIIPNKIGGTSPAFNKTAYSYPNGQYIAQNGTVPNGVYPIKARLTFPQLSGAAFVDEYVFNVEVGTPIAPSNINVSLCQNPSTALALGSSSSGSWSWTVSGANSLNYSGNQADFTVDFNNHPSNWIVNLAARQTNSCGPGAWKYKAVTCSCCNNGGGILQKVSQNDSTQTNVSFAPIPFSEELQLSFEEAPTLLEELILRNINGEVCLRITEMEGAESYLLNTSELQNGLYYYEIRTDSEIYRGTITKE